jgi:DNA topoisomerase IB
MFTEYTVELVDTATGEVFRTWHGMTPGEAEVMTELHASEATEVRVIEVVPAR